MSLRGGAGRQETGEEDVGCFTEPNGGWCSTVWTVGTFGLFVGLPTYLSVHVPVSMPLFVRRTLPQILGRFDGMAVLFWHPWHGGS